MRFRRWFRTCCRGFTLLLDKLEFVCYAPPRPLLGGPRVRLPAPGRDWVGMHRRATCCTSHGLSFADTGLLGPSKTLICGGGICGTHDYGISSTTSPARSRPPVSRPQPRKLARPMSKAIAADGAFAGQGMPVWRAWDHSCAARLELYLIDTVPRLLSARSGFDVPALASARIGGPGPPGPRGDGIRPIPGLPSDRSAATVASSPARHRRARLAVRRRTSGHVRG